jgi:hypothetical protein
LDDLVEKDRTATVRRRSARGRGAPAPNTNVSQTANAPSSGTTINSAWIHRSGAMTIGSPGRHIGTIAPARAGDGRCPAGVNVQAAPGHGADSTSGC